jgi:hypothetical protein
LIEAGLVERIGTKKSGKYALKRIRLRAAADHEHGAAAGDIVEFAAPEVCARGGRG